MSTEFLLPVESKKKRTAFERSCYENLDIFHVFFR